MSKILERVGKCWNEVNPENIKSEDKVGFYPRQGPVKMVGEVSKDIWNKFTKDPNNIFIIERSNTKKRMCFNEEVRDAIDDLCDILTEWNERLLSEYNEGKDDKECFGNIKDLLSSSDKVVWDRIEEKAKNLGGVTYEEIIDMGFFKLSRNRGVHKGKKLPKNIAFKSLNLADAQMSTKCKEGFKKCIELINHK